MDFRSPQSIIDAIKSRADHGVFGYQTRPAELVELIIDRLDRLYDWQVDEQQLVFIPGIVPALNQACRGLVSSNESVVTATPVYYPFFSAADNWKRRLHRIRSVDLSGHWQFPLEELELTASEDKTTRLLLLCNPFNPVGRVLTRAELEAIANTCLTNELLICSDEIHCDLVFDGHRHIPIASLNSDVEDITVTFIAPSKTFNIAGIGGSVAIIKNPQIRAQFKKAGAGIMASISTFGYAAMTAAYRDCEPWRVALIQYLQNNRDYLASRVANMPGMTVNQVEATYLAWLDVSELKLANAQAFFEDAGVGLSAGDQFDGAGYMRLNFACPQATLGEACDRIEQALSGSF